MADPIRAFVVKESSGVERVRVNETVPWHDGDVITIADATIECVAEPPGTETTREFVPIIGGAGNDTLLGRH